SACSTSTASSVAAFGITGGSIASNWTSPVRPGKLLSASLNFCTSTSDIDTISTKNVSSSVTMSLNVVIQNGAVGRSAPSSRSRSSMVFYWLLAIGCWLLAGGREQTANSQ